MEAETKALKARRRDLAIENRKWPPHMKQVPRDDWPEGPVPENLCELWRSRGFMCQVFNEGPIKRLSICRSALDYEGKWLDQISWEELQAIKNECGFLNHDACELFPAQDDVVNVAGMRHLWVFPGKVDFGWRKV